MIVEINETWDGRKPFGFNFRWFKLITAANPVTVRWGNSLTPSNEVTSVTAGFGFRARPGSQDFGVVEIVNSGSQAIKAYVGDDETFLDSIVGSVTVSGDVNVTDRAGRLLGVTYGSLGQLAQQSIGGVNSQVATDRGFTYGTAYKSNTALAANTPETILAPASNTNGAIVWKAGFMSHTGGTAGASILAKSSAPTSTTDGDVIASPESFILQVGGVSQMCAGKIERPVFISAGKGIYRISGALETVAFGMALVTAL